MTDEARGMLREAPVRYSDTGDRRRIQPHPIGEYVTFADWEELRVRLREAVAGHNVCEGQLQDLKDRLREAEVENKQLRKHIELRANGQDPLTVQLRERAEAAERGREGMVPCADHDFAEHISRQMLNHPVRCGTCGQIVCAAKEPS